MIDLLNNKQISILCALAKYQFLTYEQLMTLGVDQHKSNLSSQLNILLKGKKPLVRKIPHSPNQSAVFYLDRSAQNLLTKELKLNEQNIQIPRSIIKTENQNRKHRSFLVDIHIALDQSVAKQNLESVFCHKDTDKTRKNNIDNSFNSSTAIQFSKGSVIADMIFMLQTSYQKELYLLELENGIDAAKSISKCYNHATLLFEGSVHHKFNFDSAYRSLWVFENAKTMLNTQQSLSKNDYYEHIHEYFLFNTYHQVIDSFFKGWINMSGQERQLYYD